MFQVKICGITNVQDAMMCVEAGADAIGLNFYPKSSRYVDVDTAVEIKRSVVARAVVVGVFVNEGNDNIVSIANKVSLDAIQLHGDERPEDLMSLESHKIIKAFRCRGGDLEPVAKFLESAAGFRVPDSILLDAYHPNQYGGTGRTLDFEKISQSIRELDLKHWVLTGGLNPDNVVEAINCVHPSAVDTASGVEQQPGQKSKSKTLDFVTRAKQSLNLPS